MDTPDNNLEYWGLDYPPLSAYHSYGVGHLFQAVLPDSLSLFSSKGFESLSHKFWMRMSVSLSDLLLPALVVFYLHLPQTQDAEIRPKWTLGKR